MKKILIIPILIISVFLLIKNRNANEIKLGNASINKPNVSVFAMPSKKAPQLWILHHKNWPICICEINKNWVRMKDAYGTTGWVQKIYIGSHYGLILRETEALTMQKTPTDIKLLKDCIVKIKKIEKEYIYIELVINAKKQIYLINMRHVWCS